MPDQVDVTHHATEAVQPRQEPARGPLTGLRGTFPSMADVRYDAWLDARWQGLHPERSTAARFTRTREARA